LRQVPPSDLFTDAIPSYGHLMLWAKLRYALAFRRSDLQAAVREVRHLAMLVRSQRLLLAESVAIAMGRFEIHAREAAAARGADVAWWKAPDTEQLDRQRRVAFASVYFSYPGVRGTTLRQAAGCVPSPCVMLIEGATANRLLGAHGATNSSELVESLLERYSCEPEVLLRVRQGRRRSANNPLDEVRSALGEQIAQHLGPL